MGSFARGSSYFGVRGCKRLTSPEHLSPLVWRWSRRLWREQPENNTGQNSELKGRKTRECLTLIEAEQPSLHTDHFSWLTVFCCRSTAIKTTLAGHDTPANTLQPRDAPLLLRIPYYSQPFPLRAKPNPAQIPLQSSSADLRLSDDMKWNSEESIVRSTGRKQNTSPALPRQSRLRFPRDPASRWHSEQQLHPHLKSAGRGGWSNIEDLL